MPTDHSVASAPPGFVMSMYTLLRNSHAPSEKQIEGAFEGTYVYKVTSVVTTVEGIGSSRDLLHPVQVIIYDTKSVCIRLIPSC